MLLIYGNEEAFSSVGPETFAEIVRETDALNQELFESGELVGAYGVADQVNAKMVRGTGATPAGTHGPLPQGQGEPGSFTNPHLGNPGKGPGIAGPQPPARHLGVEGPPPPAPGHLQ